MKTQFKNYAAIMSGLIFLVGLIAGSADAQGNRNWDGYPNWGGSYELRQTALNEGYNEGTKAGQNDRGRGRQRSVNDYSAYRDGSKGYSSRYGDRELYRRYFQLAFQNGYNTELGIQNGGYNGYNNSGYNNNGYNNGGYNNSGYNNNGYGNNNTRDPAWTNNGNYDPNHRRGRNWNMYGTYGGSYQLRQTALNAGYNEGHKQGMNDRNRARYTNYTNNSAYRNANKDYSSRLGDLGLYQRYYREGYENGYADGMNGY